MLPFPVKPMLLETAKSPFDSPDYIFEWKVDGIRCLLHYQQGQVRLQSRTGRDCTAAFPELHNPPVSATECILDGEITLLTANKPDFEGVMGRYLAGPRVAKSLMYKKPITYVVWDILWHNGECLTKKPLMERKNLLEQVVEDNQYVTKIDWLEEKGLTLWSAVQENGLEGMVAKKKNSTYVHRRSANWLKIKNYQEAVVNVLGYKPQDGYVLVGTGSEVQGHAVGMSKNDKAALWEILSRYGTVDGPTTWLPLGIRGRVKFTTWSHKGNMRDCHWVGFEV
ncbi:hypothetical protein [Desulforamulus ferrireducens]|uniref:ATP-dependent DNA ligase family profile domain-containing protein n=1 Tax=Desulforamulus ferrireducens TaxID=1833852 RepID=A0A1S6IY53_9FIRM|nr:hypothetical protein [Desulforamulus ferrireducens]AQS59715.1 hypothetical protein B0537_11885 [Desulforamulus ferrireducens]